MMSVKSENPRIPLVSFSEIQNFEGIYVQPKKLSFYSVRI